MAEVGKSNARRYVRAVGPFDAYYLGSRKTPVRVFNLNLGGCFVSFTQEQPDSATTSFVLTIELPDEGAVTVLCQKVYRDPSGFGVRFIDLDENDSKRVASAVERMRAQQASSTPVVKLPRSSVVYTFERSSEVLQIEARYNNASQAFQIVRRVANGTTTQESFSDEAPFRSRLDEIRSELEQDGWQTAGPNLLTDG